MEEVKKSGKIGGGLAGPGRPKGMLNKNTSLLKDAILQAAKNAGGAGGLVGYLEIQATAQPAAFMSLLGKVLPMQVEGSGEDGALLIKWQD